MATNTTASGQLGNLASVLGVIQSLQGKNATQTTTQNSTSTTGSNIDQAGVDRVVQQILAGPGGVKDISGRARGAGLYNSTAELQGLNDLTARTAGEVAKLRAGTTTTGSTNQTTTLETPGLGLSSMIGPLAAITAAKPILGGLSGLVSGKGFMAGSGLDKLFGGSPSAAASAALPASTQALTPLSQVTAGGSLGGAASVGSSLNLSDLAGATDLGSVGASGVDLGATLGSSADFASTAGDFALSSVPGAGSFLGGLLNGTEPGDLGAMGILGPAAAGFAAGGPVGALASVAMSIIGNGVGSGISSVVCTALMKKGLLDKNLYAEGSRYIATLHPYTIKGYHYLFTGVAGKIDAGDQFWTRICLPWAKSRTSLVAATGWTKFWKYKLGTVTQFVGQPLCFCLGAALSLFDPETYYG